MTVNPQVGDHQGLVYSWDVGDGNAQPGRAIRTVVPLRNLSPHSKGVQTLSGRFVDVRNAGIINQPGLPGGDPAPTPLGNATPDDDGHFLFDPGRGGGRVDRVLLADDGFRWRYVQAARFGEVNVYHHVDRIAAHVHALLVEVGGPALPTVVAVVNAHHAAIQDADGHRDGVHRPDGRWVPFQGGHYRLPGHAAIVPEESPIAADGEIHLGPGQQLTRNGALSRSVAGAYRANASHNPGIIYHEYGHHITRHTADFRANRLRRWDKQSNRKTGLDEGTADYWAASLLGTPHIWFFHHAERGATTHHRSLTSESTMQTYSRGPRADPHANGTIWASALWEIRDRAAAIHRDGPGATNRLLLQALLLIGQRLDAAEPSPATVSRARRGFRSAGCGLLEADSLLYGGRLRDVIASVLLRRGIDPQGSHEPPADRVAAVPS